MRKPTNKCLPVISARLVTWSGTNGVIDGSDVPQLFPFPRIWNDACDVGFWVVSPRTGKHMLFSLQDELRDEEGEVYGWRFQTADTREAVQCGITVCND